VCVKGNCTHWFNVRERSFWHLFVSARWWSMCVIVSLMCPLAQEKYSFAILTTILTKWGRWNVCSLKRMLWEKAPSSFIYLYKFARRLIVPEWTSIYIYIFSFCREYHSFDPPLGMRKKNYFPRVNGLVRCNEAKPEAGSMPFDYWQRMSFSFIFNYTDKHLIHPE